MATANMETIERFADLLREMATEPRPSPTDLTETPITVGKLWWQLRDAIWMAEQLRAQHPDRGDLIKAFQHDIAAAILGVEVLAQWVKAAERRAGR
jgi:hypothetical protein